MDFTTKQWVVGIILVVIVAILLDGFRRMRKARRDSLHMSLNVNKSGKLSATGKPYGSEFPNGGARPSDKQIDKQRIDLVKSQYDFGRDLNISSDNEKESDIEGHVNNDQWVDSEDGDEEYYASKWDDEDVAPVEEAVALVEETEVDEVAEALELETIEESSTEEKDEAQTQVNTPDIADESYVEPEQVPLNLDEAVPMLMETVEDGISDESTDEEPTHTAVEDESVDYNAEIRSVGTRVKPAVEPTIGDSDNLDTHSANKPRYESKYFSGEVETPSPSSIKEVLVINVKAAEGYSFQGSDLLNQVLENGLRYGAMNIFHHHAGEDGEGDVVFSMANMLMPGTFDLKTIDDFSTAGVTFFLTLPVFNNESMAAFETMLATAKNVAEALNGELKDEQRSVMTAQTAEHYRERIRDFSRRQQLEKNK